MKKKMILICGSIAALLISLSLVIAPANASITSHCTSCTAIDGAGNLVTSGCHVAPIDACFCPLTGKIVTNNCLRLP